MDFEPINWDLWNSYCNDLIVIAGPCSAENEEQLMATAKFVAEQNLRLFRCGIWKPRTRAGGFEGLGAAGLKLLTKVCKRFDLIPVVEVATPEHVEHCSAHEIPLVWIGTRTVTNPFSVQSLAMTLAKTNMAVLVKNPLTPDLDLWIGALERLSKAGVKKLGAIHRGFSVYGRSLFRNSPCWNIPLTLRELFPTMPLLCDPSHMSGKRALVPRLARTAAEIGYHGLMIEVHADPSVALTDKDQQLSEADLKNCLENLKINSTQIQKVQSQKASRKKAEQRLQILRQHIDAIDEQIVNALSVRMHIVREIALQKQILELDSYQPNRWNMVLAFVKDCARRYNVSEIFVESIFQYIHEESINEQIVTK